MNKRLLFITGTRADFGKIKALLNAVKHSAGFDYQIFGTGMHTLAKYGNTITEIGLSGFDRLFTYMNQVEGEAMEVILANTIVGLSRYISENEFDLIIVHGDRVEALAGATVGALRNVRVAHIEGGEISGTVDELMRHAISKLSHIHFVASASAEQRLIQLGEDPKTIFNIGSPDVDVMLSDSLPELEIARKRYEINFDPYSIAMLHPVTTELDVLEANVTAYIDALLDSGKNYIVVYPNNDRGSEYIFAGLKRLIGNPRFRIFPSLRFEYFLTLLKNSQFIIGNSSTGIHEAPVYGVPTINIGSRQNKRFRTQSITDIPFDHSIILETIERVGEQSFEPCKHYGDGNSAKRFLAALNGSSWSISNQKVFIDLRNKKE